MSTQAPATVKAARRNEWTAMIERCNASENEKGKRTRQGARSEDEEYPHAVRHIKTTKKKNGRQRFERAFSVEEIKEIVRTTEKLLNKAMFMVAYEGNLRPHEYLNARVGQLRPFEHGFLLTVEPGLYYPRIGGVRIEDLAVVEKKGCTNLTKAKKFLEID